MVPEPLNTLSRMLLPLCPFEGGLCKCILMCAEKRAAQLNPD